MQKYIIGSGLFKRASTNAGPGRYSQWRITFLSIIKNEVNDIRAKRKAKSANPLGTSAAAPTYQIIAKEIAKPVTPQSEVSDYKKTVNQTSTREITMQKNLALLAKYFKKLYKPTNNNLQTSSNSRNKTEISAQSQYRKPKRVKDYSYHKEKMMMCKQAEQGVPLQAEQADWLADTDEEIDE
ncbi:hypothetical protein Tco_1312123 [Tanacetum coccineum]